MALIESDLSAHISRSSLVPRHFDGEENGSGTYCTHAETTLKHMGCRKQLYAASPSYYGLGCEGTPIASYHSVGGG